MDLLSQTQLNHLDATTLFEGHRRPIQDFYFPTEELCDLRTQPQIEFNCQNPYLVSDLRRCLPFGHFLRPSQFQYLTGLRNKEELIKHSRSQILYWYLARSDVGPLRTPVDHLAIYYEGDQFWFNNVAHHNETIVQHLYLEEHRIYFLQRFTLTHTFLQLEIGELRLVTHPSVNTPDQIVHTPGSTYHISWESETPSLFPHQWQVTHNHSDPRTVNPDQPYFLPPGTPGDPDFHPFNNLQEPINYYLPPLQQDEDEDDSLPDSSRPASWITPAPDPGWTTRTTSRTATCRCYPDVCYCGHRPNTPPTPPNLTLWTPGDHHLPSFH